MYTLIRVNGGPDDFELDLTTPNDAATSCADCGTALTPDPQGGQCNFCGWRPTDVAA